MLSTCDCEPYGCKRQPDTHVKDTLNNVQLRVDARLQAPLQCDACVGMGKSFPVRSGTKRVKCTKPKFCARVKALIAVVSKFSTTTSHRLSTADA